MASSSDRSWIGWTIFGVVVVLALLFRDYERGQFQVECVRQGGSAHTDFWSDEPRCERPGR